MSINFRDDLTESCEASAKFLRKKLIKIRRSTKEEIYSGEREFVCEVYRLLVNKNKSYRDNLFVDYFPGTKDEKTRLFPDLVFSDGSDNKSIVEIKVVVDKRKNGDLKLLKADKEGVDRDYVKLNEHYKHFTKFLVVAYLGDPKYKDGTEFPLEGFKKMIHKSFRNKNSRIRVIVC